MKGTFNFCLILLVLPLLLSSCEFHCNVGKVEKLEPVNTKPRKINGAVIYNGIELDAQDVELKKAWLVLKNGERVPDDNFVDFTQPVKLLLEIGEGWVEQNGQVFLGVSETIMDETGRIILKENDLLGEKGSVSVEDSKILGLTAAITLNQGSGPTSFKVIFKVWDKNGEGMIKGSYNLFSK